MRKFILIIVVLIQQTSGFTQTNPLIKYLPDSAYIVIHINPARLISKISLETLSNSPMFKDLLKDPKLPFGSMFSNPFSTGIDFLSGVFVVMINDEENSKPGSNTSVFIKLSNAELFTSKIKELFKEEYDSAIKKYGTDRILQTGKGMTIGWNNDLLVLTSGYDRKNKEQFSGLPADTIDEKDYEIAMAKLNDQKIKSQRNYCFGLLTPKPQNSFSGNSRFATFMKTEADIKTWNNGMPMLAMNKMAGLFLGSMNKIPTFTNTQKTSIVNFENGKIVLQSNNYISDDIAAVYKKYPSSSLNTELVKRLPKGKLLGVVITSFNPEMGKEIMGKIGLQQKLKDLKTPMPFDMDLFTGTFGNNIMLAMVQADENEEADSLTHDMKNIKLVLAMPIINKIKFDALKKSVQQSMDSIHKEKQESGKTKGITPVVKNNESLLVVSLSPEVANSFLNNSSLGIVPEWLLSKSQYPMVMNMNLKEIMKMLMGKKISGKTDKGDQTLLDMFDQLIIYGGNFENESIATTMEFHFSNQTENALKQLINLISRVADKKMGNDSEEKKD